MHLNLPRLLSTLALLGTSVSAAPLVDENFDQPTELTLHFPPKQGEQTVYHGRFSGWSSVGKGVMTITYGAGLGKDKTGGMLCTAERISPEYNVIQYGPIFPDLGEIAYVTVDKVSRFVIEFDANIPAGKRLQPYFNIKAPEDMVARVYPSRLIFEPVTGTGKFERYTLRASTASPASLQAFAQLIIDLGLNGATETELTAIFQLQRGDWVDGDSFQFDNLKISLVDPLQVKN
jgi:hypothetical protein